MSELDRLDRLQKVFRRLADPNEGTRYAAANALYNMCVAERVSIVDLTIVPSAASGSKMSDRAEIECSLRRLAEVRLEACRDIIARQRKEIDGLKAKMDDTDHLRQHTADLQKQVADLTKKLAMARELINELHGPVDPWHDQVVQYLAELDAATWRLSTEHILEEALGIPPRLQDVDAARRLARIIRKLELGWEPSSNVPARGGRVRGYVRQRY